MRFTFKTDKPTGSYASFSPDYIHIKLNKIEVGQITDNSYKIRLMVYKDNKLDDGNKNCNWMWITLKKENKTLQEAKDFLNSNIDKLLEAYSLVKE